jgi:hypothetical protein
MFEKLCITPECFERTQQELMNDPYVSMELFNLGISMEQPAKSQPPEVLTSQKTIELVKASNDFAFQRFKDKYMDETLNDPMIMPVLISSMAFDWVKLNHQISEEELKSALFVYRVYENPTVSEQMQKN